MTFELNIYRRLWIFSLRYIPVVNAFLMLCHVLMLLLGISSPNCEFVSGISVSVLIAAWLASKAHCFCYLHRLFIYYAFAVYFCIFIQRWDAFGEFIEEARFIMFILGSLLFIYTFSHLKAFNHGCRGKFQSEKRGE